MTPTLAAIVWGIGLVAWVVIRIPHQRRARKIKVANNAKTLADRLALGAATVGLSLIPIVYVTTGFPAFADYAFQPWLAWIGLFVEIAFLWLFYASHRQLGKNWSVSLEIRREHKLVTDGLYKGAEGYVKRIRHARKVLVAIQGVAVVALSNIHPQYLQKIEEPSSFPA